MRYILTGCVVGLLAATLAWADGMPDEKLDAPGLPGGAVYVPAQALYLTIGKPRILDAPVPIQRISIGDQAVVDVVMLKSRQAQIFGLSLGTTNVMFWDQNERLIRSFNVEVTHDLDTLKEKFYRLLPGEAIQAHSSRGTIVLSGEVSSLGKMDAALSLAKSMLLERDGKISGEVLNMMQIGGNQQVMLEVQVAEISRTLMKRLSMNFNAFSPGSPWSVGAVNGGASFPDAIFEGTGGGEGRIPVFTSVPYGPAVTEFAPNELRIEDKGFFATFLGNDLLFNVVLDAAKENGLAKILAEPTLTTLTGQEASFLAGGEFPVPVPNEDGVTIEYREYGIGLKFLPVVLDSGTINLKVNITVSELTNANSVIVGFEGTASNLFVPGLTKRSANSTVSLANGQTIGIAGLINETLREKVNKFPVLGDVPVLGNLFRSQEYVKGQTELVIFVTPHFAKPIERDQIRLPTDAFVEPSDVEFYLMGKIEGEPPVVPELQDPATQGGLEGQFGHDL